MSPSLQAVEDKATDQNFRQLDGRFPLQPQDLADSVKELFVRAVGGGPLKVNTGFAEATYGGGSIEATQAITHGLGVTVKFADISPEDPGYVPGTKTYGATTFTATVQKRDGSTPANGTKAKFHWIAIG